MVKITVLGSYNQDITMITPKIPRPKETISGARMFLNPGGKGNNQANAAHKLGADVLFLTKVGTDPFGDTAIAYFQSIGLSIEGVLRDRHTPTGVAVILVDEKTRENQITVAPGANHQITVDEIEKLKGHFESNAISIFQLEIPLETVLFAMKITKAGGGLVILNPAPIPEKLPEDLFVNVDILILNEIEAEAISLHPVNNIDTASKTAQIIAQEKQVIAIITMGNQGVIAHDGKTAFFHPAFKVNVKDTTGAGDAFIGGFAVKFGETRDLKSALEYASATAALNTTRIGASSANPDKQEVDAFLMEK
jgi:ribokinase